ncbi:hypothetical protein D7Y15_05600 [Corallococcus sp. AB030]|nr:hypothetical protein D7Y15_05600 [Corallococcus sp. AB030]
MRIRSEQFSRGLIVLAGVLASSASAQDLPPEISAVNATDSAAKRDSQPTVDPWMASSSTALFGRPTVGESFKFSSEASSTGTVLSVGFSPGALWAPGNPKLTNLQVASAYSIGDGIGSFSLKWAAPFRDVRTFSTADWQRVSDASVKAYEACDAEVKDKSEEGLAPCLEKRTAAEDSEIARIRPGLSLGASVGYGFRSQRLERLAANVAYDQKLWSGTSLIINADMESQLRELPQEDGGLRVERAWQAGGSVGLAWRPGVAFLKQRLELSAGAKVLQCLQSCGENPSSVKFGPQASFALDKNTVLGASVNWTGEASSLRDALVGVAVSHSFGLLK